MKTGGKIYKVTISYDCPAYTPFYKTMYKVTRGTQYIKLYAQAAYKAPEHLNSFLIGANKQWIISIEKRLKIELF